MKFTILVYESAAELGSRTDDRRKSAYWGAYRAYTQALREAGVMVGGSALQPPAVGITVRQRGGQRQVQDGPFAETKEQLGGYYEIDAREAHRAAKDVRLSGDRRSREHGGGMNPLMVAAATTG